MRNSKFLNALAIVLAVSLLVVALPIVSIAEDTATVGYETIVAEVVNRDGVSGVDASKTNYFNKYRVSNQSTSFYSFGNAPSIIKLGGNGVSAVNAAQTFLFDLNDATVNFTPYVAFADCSAKLSVYGSKDGEIWLPLIVNETPVNQARLGNNSEWNPDADVTERGVLSDWSNYNTANMNSLLSNNADKRLYIKFCYVGNGSADLQVKAFGVTATYSDRANTVYVGTENYISSAGNRSAEGAYWDNTKYETDSTRESYFQKYMLVDKSDYRGLNEAAQFYSGYQPDSGKNTITFKYDLNDATVDFTPVVWVNANGKGVLKVEISKDGSTWYEALTETVNGDKVAGGLIYGSPDEAPYVDKATGNYCASAKGKEWTALNKDNIKAVLEGNSSKTVYVRYSRAAAMEGEDLQLNGFGLVSKWDASKGTETFAAEVVNRSGKTGADATKSNYFEKYRVSGKSTGYVSFTDLTIIKFGGSYIGDLNAQQTFLFDLNDATVNFTPYIATADYNKKLSVYGSKDGEIWLPLILNEEPGSHTRRGNNAEWNPDSDVTQLGALTAWSNYNTANMKALLKDNAEKKVYVKFCYVGDGSGEAQAKAFGVTASYDVYAEQSSATGAENYLSNGSNRSGAGAYSNNSYNCINDAAKDSYLDKYMLADDSKFQGLTHIIKFNSGDKITFKYDLDDSTVDFTPVVWIGEDANAKLKIEVSKDGNAWYELLTQDVTGSKELVNSGSNKYSAGRIYGNTENSAYFDSVYAAYCPSEKGAVWTEVNADSVKAVLNDNPTKVIYIRFVHMGADANGANEAQYRGFGITTEFIDLAAVRAAFLGAGVVAADLEIADKTADGKIDILDIVRINKMVN